MMPGVGPQSCFMVRKVPSRNPIITRLFEDIDKMPLEGKCGAKALKRIRDEGIIRKYKGDAWLATTSGCKMKCLPEQYYAKDWIDAVKGEFTRELVFDHDGYKHLRAYCDAEMEIEEEDL